MMYRKIEFQNYLIAFVFSLAVHDLLILEQGWKENKFCKKKGTVSYILEFQVQLWLISQQYCSLMLDTTNYMANDSLMIKENLFKAIYFCLFLGVIYPMTEHLTSDLPSAWLLPYVSSM